MRKNNKKAVAPIIATVLLILIVLTLASIILIWGLSFIPESISKFDKPIEEKCKEIDFSVDVSDYSGLESSVLLSIVNKGDIPIYKIGVKEKGQTRSEIKEYKKILGAGQGAEINIDLNEGLTGLDIIPILLGVTDKGDIQEFTCAEENWKPLTL